jgi:hypothetical protein
MDLREWKHHRELKAVPKVALWVGGGGWGWGVKLQRTAMVWTCSTSLLCSQICQNEMNPLLLLLLIPLIVALVKLRSVRIKASRQI